MRCRLKCGWWTVVAGVWLAASVRAATTTNAADVPGPVDAAPTIVLGKPADPFPGFWEVYADQLERSGNRMAADRLQAPDAAIHLMLLLNQDQYQFNHFLGRLGGGIFSDGALDGLRETAVRQLPFAEWESEESPLPEQFLAKLVDGSVGNTFEERMGSVIVSSAYTGQEQSWLNYGVRPWQLHPYVYVTLAFGRFAGKPVLLDTRCYSLLDSQRTGLMKIQEQMLIPLFDSCHIVVELFLYPTEMQAPDRSPGASVRLEKALHVGKFSELVFVGAQAGPRRAQCMAGFALIRW